MTDTDRRTDERRWRPRPLLSTALRVLSVLVPAAAGAATAYAFVVAVPMPRGAVSILWFLGIAVSSTIATALAERIGKRVLPLAMLLRLSLVFPDRAPSRFAMARGAGNVRLLERRIAEARDHGIDEAPVRAAEQILSLVAALSAHDRKTRGHSERVRAFTDLVANELRLADEDREHLRWAALLHDVGKLHVPGRILNKPGRPEPREWETLKRHPAAGAAIAAPLLSWLGTWGDAIEQHHERFDGGGYPNGLEGDDISFAARIVSVADSFEVMTAARSYKRPMSVPAARRELAACAGSQFDPAIVRAFLNVSLGRLWWTVGPTSWTALLPVVGPVQRAGGQLAGAARAAAAAIAVSVGGLVPVMAAAASPPAVGAVPMSLVSGPLPSEGSAAFDDASHGTGAIHHSGDGGGVPGDQGAEAGSDGGSGGSGGGSGGSDGGSTDGGDVLDGTTDAVDGVVDGTTDAVDGVVDGTTDAVDGVVDGTTNAVEGVVEGTTDVVDAVVGGSSDPIDGAASSLTAEVDDAVDAVTDVAGGLLGG